MAKKSTPAKKSAHKKRVNSKRKGGAPKGNKFWMVRTKHGRDKLFSSPEVLWKAACEYFQWCDDNPWYKNETVKAGEHFGKNVQASIPRPYTISGLCIFLDIDQQTLNNYGSKEEYKDFFGVVSKIKEIIYTQKFEGATVGVFNANIIARDLGLIDKQRKEHTGLGGKARSHKDMSKNEIARRIAFTLYQGIKAQERMKGDKIS